MRPLSISIEGLASYRTRQEADFSDLGLFVITGPTGSGKSSILDAITFALYGRVPRVTKHQLKDLISHGSSFARVSLDFEVDGRRYLATRRMGRKGAQSATVERLEHGVAVTEVDQSGVTAANQRLDGIVGLDFDTFIRAVLLPQGAFDRFLKGDVDERRDILIRLLDLDRYLRAGEAARARAGRLDAEITAREALIDANYQSATRERLTELERVFEAGRRRHEALAEARRRTREISQGAGAARDRRTPLAEGIAGIHRTVGELGPLGDEWPALAEEGLVVEAALADAKAALDAAAAALADARAALADTTARTGDREALTRIEGAAGTLAAAHSDIDAIDAELVSLRADAEASAGALESAGEVLKTTTTALTARGAELNRADAAREGARAVRNHAEAAERLAGLTGELETAIVAHEEERARSKAAKEWRRHLEQEHAAAALRAGLEPGDLCPVCGEAIEALPVSDTRVDELLAEAGGAVTAAERGEGEARELVVELTTKRTLADKEVGDTLAALDGAAPSMTAEEAGRMLADAEAMAREAAQHEREASTAREAAQVALGAAENDDTACRGRVDGAERRRTDAVKRRDGARNDLEGAFAGPPPDDLEDEIARRREALAGAEDAVRAAKVDLEAASRAHEGRRTGLALHEKHLVAFDGRLLAARTAAALRCDALGKLLEGCSLPLLPDASDDRLALLAAWEECCSAHREEAARALVEAEQTIADAVAALRELAEAHGIPAAADDPESAARAIEEAEGDAGAAAARAQGDVKEERRRVEEREALEGETDRVRGQRDLYAALGRELRADNFITDVVKDSMEVLAMQASEELRRISDGRYSLVADQGRFDVVDHHNADDRRSVATLSGGETFLASLSLALALSVGLRELAGAAASRLDAIFIDEGFGNLDVDTLDVVIDALERLSEGDRMVGVISHVEALAQRIPAGLAVEREGGGSRIVAR